MIMQNITCQQIAQNAVAWTLPADQLLLVRL